MMKQSKYNINILNVWGDEIDLYVDFIIENKETNEFAHGMTKVLIKLIENG